MRLSPISFALVFLFAIAGEVPAQETNEESLVSDPIPPVSSMSAKEDDFSQLSQIRRARAREQLRLERNLLKLRGKLLQSETADSLRRTIESETHTRDRERADLDALKSRYENISEEDKGLTIDQLDGLRQIRAYPDDIAKHVNAIKKTEKALKAVLALKSEIAEKERLIETGLEAINDVERRIADVLNIERAKNSFKVLISLTFCLLVALVVLGFYYIALRNDEIASAIFSGEKGIQFVTLFLIIIAIILFGIMGILEGKELAALLGGLSGYILGRSSLRPT